MTQDELLKPEERDRVRKGWLRSKSQLYDDLIQKSAKAQIAKSHKHRLDRPDREKIAELLNWYGQANPYIDWHVEGNDEIKNYRREQAKDFLPLFDEEEIREQIASLGIEISELNKKLDDKEADLILAKREERERIIELWQGTEGWILGGIEEKEMEHPNIKLSHIKSTVKLFGQALKENNDS